MPEHTAPPPGPVPTGRPPEPGPTTARPTPAFRADSDGTMARRTRTLRTGRGGATTRPTPVERADRSGPMTAVRRGAVVVLAGLAVLGLVGCDAAAEPESDPAEPVPPTTAAPSDDCPESGALIVDAGSDAATGFRAQVLRLTNCGSAELTVEGYPELSLLDAEGRPCEVAITHGAESIPDPGPEPITLAPGESVTTVLSWHNTVEFGDPVTAESLLVSAGPGEPDQPVALDHPVDLGTTGTLDTTAWTPATPD